MKKYWKTIVISLVIILTISTYYIQLAKASKDEISLELENVTGNNEEIKHLTIQGSFNDKGMYRQFTLQEGRMINQEKLSYLQTLTTIYAPRPIQKYIEEHRNFMRGKDYNPTLYAEDDLRIIYAAIANKKPLYEDGKLKLQIELLDKQTKDRTTFEVMTHGNISYRWANIFDVFAEDKIIKILVYLQSLDGGEELRLYTVDVNKQQLEEEAIIAQVNNMSHMNMVYNMHEIQNNPYFAYNIKQNSEDEEGERAEIINQQVYVYNVNTNENKELEIPENIKLANIQLMIDEEELVIYVKKENSIEINRYNMKHNDWEEPVTFATPGAMLDKENTFMHYMNGKLYVVFRTTGSKRLLIGDIYTGKTLYEGQFVINDGENLSIIDGLYIDDIYTLD